MSAPHTVFFATLFVSSAAIGYEILLMRLLSIVQWHHFAYMIISLALLGYGASGTVIAMAKRTMARRFQLTFGISALLFGVTMIASFVIGQRLPFNALEIVWDMRQLAYLGVIYLVFFVPFLFAATCIGLALTCLKAHVSRVYFFDLLGAGFGAVVIIGALFAMSPQSALKLLCALAITASGLVMPRFALANAATLALLLFAVPQSWLDLRISPFKGLSQALEVVDSRILATRSNPLGFLTVIESPTVPFRDAPGLSLNSRSEPPEQLAIFTDADAMTVINRFDGSFEPLAYLNDMTSALPYQLLDDPRVLVLGAGGGTDVLMALYHGARAVDAVELNPEIVTLVTRDYADFAGHLYEHERVTVHVGEARGFVSRAPGSYGLIHIALMDSFAASGSGVQSLSESYLYTVEAITEYLGRLESGGILAVTRWLRVPPRDSLKLIASAAEALRRAGVERPADHIALIRSWSTSTILIARRAFGASEVASIRAFAQARSFDTEYFPSITSGEVNRFNVLAQPYFFDGASALLGADAVDFIERYKFDITPPTDDRPYFFHFFKWRALPESLALRHRGGAGLIDWGYLILVGTLVQALVAGAVIILLPLAFRKREWPRAIGARMGSYFLVLGIAFMFIEMAFIQKLLQFLSHPLYSVAVVLSGFLTFAGIGSAYSSRILSLCARFTDAPLKVVVLAIAAAAILYLGLLPGLFERWAGSPDIYKVGISLVIIAPLAFLMGMPFPFGLGVLASNAPEFVPWAWGLNGFASVVSASLATLLAIDFGFTFVVLTALLLYGSAVALLGRKAP